MFNLIRVNVLALAVLMSAIGLVGYKTFANEGLGYRLLEYDFGAWVEHQISEVILPYGSTKSYIDACDFIYGMKDQLISESCHLKNKESDNQVLLWGDSYAQMLTYGLIKNLPKNWQLLQVASRGCQPSIFESKGSLSDYCRQSNYFALETIVKVKPKVVILAQNNDLTAQNAHLFSDALHRLGVQRVIFVGKPPEWTESLSKLAYRTLPKPLPVFTKYKLDEAALNKSKEISKASLKLDTRDSYINLIDILCKSQGCMVYVGDKPSDSISTLDGRHLTPSASNYVARNSLVLAIIQ